MIDFCDSVIADKFTRHIAGIMEHASVSILRDSKIPFLRQMSARAYRPTTAC